VYHAGRRGVSAFPTPAAGDGGEPIGYTDPVEGPWGRGTQVEVVDAIVHRRSVRAYAARPVESGALASLLECARMAPSASNTQPWRFIVVQSTGQRERVAAVCAQAWMLQAPVFIVGVADIRARLKSDAPIALDESSPEYDLKRIIRDVSMALEHVVLQAESIGLATCWIGRFLQKDLRPALGIPEDKYVVGILTVGYPAERPDAKPRKAMEEIAFWETWGGTSSGAAGGPS
jgi:nitroreductase